MNEQFHKRLREAMLIRDMQQVDLVEKTGIAKSAISAYVNGEYLPKQINTHKIAQALRVDEGWLMGKDVDMEPSPPLGNIFHTAGQIPARLTPKHLFCGVKFSIQQTNARLRKCLFIQTANRLFRAPKRKPHRLVGHPLLGLYRNCNILAVCVTTNFVLPTLAVGYNGVTSTLNLHDSLVNCSNVGLESFQPFSVIFSRLNDNNLCHFASLLLILPYVIKHGPL